MALNFWRSKTFILWLQYLAAGIAMIPAGVMYFFLIGEVGQRKASYISLIVAISMGLIRENGPDAF